MRLIFARLEDTPFGGAERYLKDLKADLTDNADLKASNVTFETWHCTAPKWLPAWLKALWFDRQVRSNKQPDDIVFALSRLSSADIHLACDGVHAVYKKICKPRSCNPLHPVMTRLERRAVTNAKIVIAISDLVQRDLINTYGPGIKDKIRVITNGMIDCQPSPNFKRSQLCQSIGINPDRPTILFVGSGFYRKGVDRFLQTIKEVTSPVNAVIVGKDKKLEHYRSLAKSLGVDHCCWFVPQQKNIYDYFALADIYLFLPRYEPFGNVVLEAMTLDNAVIASHGCGASCAIDPEYITDDCTHAATLINQLLADSSLIAQVKQRNKTHVRTHYTHSQNVSETLKAIQELITTG